MLFRCCLELEIKTCIQIKLLLFSQLSVVFVRSSDVPLYIHTIKTLSNLKLHFFPFFPLVSLVFPPGNANLVYPRHPHFLFLLISFPLPPLSPLFSLTAVNPPTSIPEPPPTPSVGLFTPVFNSLGKCMSCDEMLE